MTTPQPQPSAETRAGELACRIQHDKYPEQLGKTLSELTTIITKAEALDWLENNKVDVDYRAEIWDVCHIDHHKMHVVSGKGKTLLEAITAARKESE
jgi:hypothetical protein